MILVAVIFLTFLFTTFLGYVIHWNFHQRWGYGYKKHMAHHLKLYPPGDLISYDYREAGDDSTARMFIVLFSPILLGVVLLTAFHVISIMVGVAVFSTMGIVGILNDGLHDSFHVKRSMWHLFPGFQRLQKIHNTHHYHMGTNYGIFSFMWDKVFGTYKNN
jgi:sterol desaturase/sphingolipid hydroxylase (fatty acid hydroxylase superfamily)